ncbi:hypothetical protein ACFQWB_04835 [Paenibacillus thermoaerophilus]|uniref:Uncharacterized protein n=1 Tax=Paenibacillus thermoaerophilus TaxID=1215385 RepID=A0ABW2V206_9BACL|nr:hypothetical protein [Paenibacillus thermoaerophilus]TMV14402.1 hypothetical protein FE781_10815 [Paenibacillus thermoaerophilus]
MTHVLQPAPGRQRPASRNWTAWLAAAALLLASPAEPLHTGGAAYAAAEVSAARVDSGLPSRTPQQIAQMWNKLAPAWENGGEPFQTAPSTAAPHDAGSLHKRYMEGGVARANLYRYLAPGSPPI